MSNIQGVPKKCYIILQANNFGNRCCNNLKISENVQKQIRILYLMFYFLFCVQVDAVHSRIQSPSCDMAHPVDVCRATGGAHIEQL